MFVLQGAFERPNVWQHGGVSANYLCVQSVILGLVSVDTEFHRLVETCINHQLNAQILYSLIIYITL